VIVDHRGEQVVRRCDGVEIAGEMQVDVLHRNDLRKTAAGRPALHAEAGTEAGFAQREQRVAADAVHAVGETDRHRGLALAGRRRRDRGDEDQLAIGAPVERLEECAIDLGLAAAIGDEGIRGDAGTSSDCVDRQHRRGTRDRDVRRQGLHHLLPPKKGAAPWGAAHCRTDDQNL